ncbi:DUF393 domain-containing protein [Rheinheimera sp. UJ51]|uniref:DCC1-like thiol-disulfide oxidoreductase family protein n=1 Tax=Rheinheimera sp. UJ51 TaxID=2892446 RepID=UPI001E50E459|nr:DCC1-like thiol-disulfide oxidoreductase family protein [Rheinheimera sp. UJ51]MCC5452488.1 DUF393 domain-containing protein [Rheinheimera sp. UJ51]
MSVFIPMNLLSMTHPNLAEAALAESVSSLALFYDEGCPACRFYSRRVRLQAALGQLQLIDVRAEPHYARLLASAGYQIEQGMVLRVADSWYGGADALQMLALLSSRSNVFNRFNFWLFKSPRRAKVWYPVLRSARNSLLWLLRLPKIQY